MDHVAKRILFVCFGNICRSPMAEAMARELGEARIAAESAGIGAIPGNIATPGAVHAAKESGLDLVGHRARFAGDLDLNEYDLVVAMTPAIAARLRHDPGIDDERLLILDIDDPYGGDVEDYRRCATEIEAEVRKLLDDIQGNGVSPQPEEERRS